MTEQKKPDDKKAEAKPKAAPLVAAPANPQCTLHPVSAHHPVAAHPESIPA